MQINGTRYPAIASARAAAIELGATHEHVSYYPRSSFYTNREDAPPFKPFGYHWFKNGVEIARLIVSVDGDPIGSLWCGKREWDPKPELTAIKQEG